MFDEERVATDGGAAVLAHVGQGWREIDRQMRRIAKRRAALDAEEAPVMLAAMRADVHVHLGYGSFVEYLERACGYAPRTARERVRVAEAIEDLPTMRASLEAGELSFSAVRELSRVATAETEAEWLSAIAGCTVREIEDEMRGRKAGDRPGDRPDPAIEPRRVKLEMTPETYALFLEARRAMERETGGDMTDSEFMAIACRRVLAGETGGGGNTPSHTIAVSTCRDCGRAWQETGGKSIELAPSALERARCDAIDLGDVDGPTPPKATRTIPAPMRRAVLARDHRRCTVPGCRSSQFVDVHHLMHRAHGGAHQMSNLITLCSRHHTSAHDGRIIITGSPGALHVTHADGRPYGTPPPPTTPPTPRHSRLASTSPLTPTPRPPSTVPAPRCAAIPDAPARSSTMATAPRSAAVPSSASTPQRASPSPHARQPDIAAALTTSVADDVELALVSMGLKRAEATRILTAAMAHVGHDPTLDELLRASLRAYQSSRI